MQANAPFTAMHMQATALDFKGNGRLGRYILLPGSDGRAELMAKRLKGVKVIAHARRHNLYLGHIVLGQREVDVGIMSSGMGCPSLDIIGTELLNLGVRRLIRVGTAGSLQPSRIRVGSLVVPTAAVRDEGTSRHYLDASIPVLAHLEFLDAVRRAALELKIEEKLYLGLTHTKDSLYAREFGAGPLKIENKAYMQHLTAAGVLASEMECAQLFTLAQVWNQELQGLGGPSVRAGAILAIVGDDQPFNSGALVESAIESAIDLSFATITEWAKKEDLAWL